MTDFSELRCQVSFYEADSVGGLSAVGVLDVNFEQVRLGPLTLENREEATLSLPTTNSATHLAILERDTGEPLMVGPLATPIMAPHPGSILFLKGSIALSFEDKTDSTIREFFDRAGIEPPVEVIPEAERLQATLALLDELKGES